MRDRRDRAATLVRIERERAPHGFVGGLHVQSEGSATLEVDDASDGTPLGRCPIAHPRDIERAAEAARRATEELQSLGAEGRAACLDALCAELDEQREDLAILECLQTGRSFREVLRDDLEGCARALRAAASGARTAEASLYDLGKGTYGFVELAPRPVIGVVLPPAEPLAAVLRHLFTSIQAGAGIVALAPSEAPLAVLRLGALVRDAGLPPGTLNVLTSDGRDAPIRLAESSSVHALAFAGPREVARHVLVGAARSNLKPVWLELDDKVPCVLLEDASVARGVEVMWRSALSSPCQLSRSIGRALVHESIYDEVADRLTSLARATVVGHPLDEHTELGPLASSERMKRVLAYVELGRREGAKLVAGGARDIEGARIFGHFVQPTLFLDPPREGRLAREPIEGPVLTIEPFSTAEDAIARAATRLGRGTALVFSQDPPRARRLGRKLGVGQLFINGPVRLFPALPHARAGEVSIPLLGRSSVEAASILRTVVVDGEDL